MRTTLNIDDDAIEMAKGHARRRKVSLGEAISELVRRGAERRLEIVDRNGLKVARLPARSPVVTSERVRELLDELP